MRKTGSCFLFMIFAATITACGFGTDAATRLAYDIEAGAGHLGSEAGARYTVQHHTPSSAGECTGPYTLQIDKVGLIVIWCKDTAGHTVSSHSTSYYARFADTPRTYLLDKPASSTLMVDLERRDGRAVITDAR